MSTNAPFYGVSRAITHASYNQQKDNPSVTEIVEIPNRGHALTIRGRGQGARVRSPIRFDGEPCNTDSRS